MFFFQSLLYCPLMRKALLSLRCFVCLSWNDDFMHLRRAPVLNHTCSSQESTSAISYLFISGEHQCYIISVSVRRRPPVRCHICVSQENTTIVQVLRFTVGVTVAYWSPSEVAAGFVIEMLTLADSRLQSGLPAHSARHSSQPATSPTPLHLLRAAV